MKKSSLKKMTALGIILALGVGVLTGCGSSKDKSTIVIAGSTSVQPLSEALAEKYTEDNSNVKIDVQGGGSGQAVKSLDEEIAQIGALSREVKGEEKSAVSKEYVIAMDGVAVVVNTEVNVKDLTLEQVKDIYTGKITNWKEVGGKDAKIAVISREEGSGTRGAFTEITGVLEKDEDGNEKDNTTKDAIVQPSTGAVTETVSTTPNSIGYISLSSLNDKVKAVEIEGVKPTKETVKNKTYKVSRPFIYVVPEKVNEQTQAFIDFVLSKEGQKLIEENGFIPAN